MRKLPAVAVTALLAVLLIAVLTTAILTTAVLSGKSASPAAAPPPAPAQPAAPAQPGAPDPAVPAPAAPGSEAPGSVAFLGDGYTSGSPAGGQGPANYTALLAEQNRWQVVTNDSVYGSGYVAGPALPTRLQRVVAAAPELVVVTAGRADDQSDPAAVGAAATQLYQDLRAQLPQARIAVIGPMWLGGDAPPRMLAVRDAIRGAATGAGLPFVDPLAEGWFNGSDQDGIAPDGEILNDQGHQRLAQLVDEALDRSGLVTG